MAMTRRSASFVTQPTSREDGTGQDVKLRPRCYSRQLTNAFALADIRQQTVPGTAAYGDSSLSEAHRGQSVAHRATLETYVPRMRPGPRRRQAIPSGYYLGGVRFSPCHPPTEQSRVTNGFDRDSKSISCASITAADCRIWSERRLHHPERWPGFPATLTSSNSLRQASHASNLPTLPPSR